MRNVKEKICIYEKIASITCTTGSETARKHKTDQNCAVVRGWGGGGIGTLKKPGRNKYGQLDAELNLVGLGNFRSLLPDRIPTWLTVRGAELYIDGDR